MRLLDHGDCPIGAATDTNPSRMWVQNHRASGRLHLRASRLLGAPGPLRYRAANPEGTKRWKELEHMSRPQGPPAPGPAPGPAAQTMRNRLTFSLLEKINVPTLLLTGDADLFAPPPVLKLFADRIKNSQSLVVPEAGHSTYWEKPDIFNRAVLGFIRKH